MYPRQEIDEKLVDILYKSYYEQVETGENIHRRVSYFTATNSILLTAILTVLRIMLEKDCEVLVTVIFTIIICSLLLTSLVLCCVINVLRGIKALPNESVIKTVRDYSNLKQFNNDEIDMLGRNIKDNAQINKKKTLYYNIATMLMIIAIIIMFLGTVVILISYSI